MSANVESMVWLNEKPWHGMGYELTGDESLDEIIRLAGLDWKVGLKPMMTVDGIPIPDNFALVRDSDNFVLSITGKNYRPTQNKDAFEFFREFTDKGGMKIETAGSLNHGRDVWALASLNQSFDVWGDKINGYLLLHAPHIYGKAISGLLTTVRVVCNNTLNLAMSQDGKNAARHFHVKEFDITSRDAMKVKLLGEQSLDEFRQVVETLAGIEASKKIVADFYIQTFELQPVDGRIEIPKIVRDVEQCRLNAPGHAERSANDTLWGLVNGVSYFTDHVRHQDSDKRVTSAFWGASAKLKAKALTTAIDIAADLKKAA